MVLLALCLSAGTVYAFFFAVPPQQTADAQTGIVQVQLNEDFPVTDENGAPLDTLKTFSGENTGNKMTYVRARIFASPEYHFIGTDASNNSVDEWRPIALPISDFTITTTSPDWIDGGDGYLYYRKILNPTDLTTATTVTLEVNDTSALPAGMDVRLNVRVTLEAAQATHDAWKTVFGITDLPVGVETLNQTAARS
jgi:hypothetical protein